MKKLSIIIPVFNAERTLSSCLESIIKQQFNNFEVLIIDDGSTDNSSEIIEKYCKKYDFITSFFQANSGVSKARNLGICQSNSEFIMFMDSDDLLADGALVALFAYQEKYKAEVVIGNYQLIHNKTTQKRKQDFIKWNDFRELTKYFDQFYLEYTIHHVWGNLYQNKNIICFNEEYVMGEDIIFNLHNMKNHKNIVFMEETIYYYNHDNIESATKKYDENKFLNARKLKLYIEQFLIENLNTDKHKKTINAIFIGDLTRSIQRLVLWTDLPIRDYFTKVKSWVKEPLVREAFTQMYIGNFTFFSLFFIYYLRLQYLLVIIFKIQKIIMRKTKNA